MSEGEKGENKTGAKFSLYTVLTMFTLMLNINIVLPVPWFTVGILVQIGILQQSIHVNFS